MSTFSEERRTENNMVEEGNEPEVPAWWEGWVLPLGLLLASVIWGLAIFGALELFI